MYSTTLLYQLSSKLIALFFALFGLLIMVLPWYTPLYSMINELLVEHNLLVALVGLAIFSVGGMLLFSGWGKKRRTYYVRCGNNSLALDLNCVETYLEHYWKKQFPKAVFSTNAVLTRKGELHLTADLPPLPFAQQKSFLEKAEREIASILATKLGYTQPFTLSVSFAA